MSSLTLYNYFRSSTSFRARIGLELKGLEYTYKPIHLLSGEHHQAEYRDLNPFGGVPTLAHGDKVISQSLVILEYLDDVFPETYQLFPKEPYMSAKIKQFCEIINADMHAFGNLKLLQYLEKKHGYDQAEKERWVQHWFSEGFVSLEKMLQQSSHDYCFGDVITAADVLLVPLVVTAERFKVDLSPYSTILKIHSNCLRNPAFIKAHPFRQPDTPIELKVE